MSEKYYFWLGREEDRLFVSCHAASISAVRYQVFDILGFNGPTAMRILLFKIREIWG